jgi:hypothetical protein
MLEEAVRLDYAPRVAARSVAERKPKMARKAKGRSATPEPAARPSIEGALFSRGWVGRRDLAWVLAHDDPDDGSVTRVMQCKGDNWLTNRIGWSAVAVTARLEPAFELVVVGTEGKVLAASPTGFAMETVATGRDGPDRLGVIRDARFIGAEVFAVGMSRQAYRRVGPSRWVRADAGLAPTATSMTGLNGVDGTGAADVFAAGFNGEIWHYDGAVWQPIESPTNVALQRVRCAPDGHVYLCGVAGTLLRGDRRGFLPIAQDGTNANLQALEWFMGRLYVASAKGLFVLDGDSLEPLDVAPGEGLTFGDLHAADGVLWSVGARHLFRTDDGTTWTQVFAA